MAVQANLSDGPVEIALSDTVILQPGPNRAAVTAAILHNTASASRQVKIYESPDNTSASGDEVADITLDSGEALPVEEIIGQSYSAGMNLIAVAQDGSSSDVLSRITYTQFTGSS